MADMDLLGKTFVISGATAGIGLATAEALVSAGANVIGIGRSTERCHKVESRLRSIRPDVAVDYMTADLSEQRNVRSVARQVQQWLEDKHKTALDGLVNNAAIFTYWFTQTADGIELQWAVNHLAPFLLTHELLPLLHNAPAARVVTISSTMHNAARLNWNDLQLCRHYNGLAAYANTKLANILFTLELNRRLGSTPNVRAFAADPGLVKTDIGFKEVPAIAAWVWRRLRARGIEPQESARGIAFLASDPSIQHAEEIYWKHCHPQRASRKAMDRAAARRLWELSAQMCGLGANCHHKSNRMN
jgi:NAD(P)-dependent dehydrogenase (short-subunit alcohol dehydrogenase family)